MSGMGDDFNDGPESGVMPAHPAEQHATYRAACAELMRQRDAVISSAAVRAMQDAARMFDATAGRPFTGADPGMLQDDDKGLSKWLASTPEAMRCAREAAAQISAAPLTDAQVVAACLAYRHDYGLLLPHAKERIALECRQWDEALKKARHPLADAFSGAMDALYAPAAPLLRDLGAAMVQHLPADDTEGGAA